MTIDAFQKNTLDSSWTFVRHGAEFWMVASQAITQELGGASVDTWCGPVQLWGAGETIFGPVQPWCWLVTGSVGAGLGEVGGSCQRHSGHGMPLAPCHGMPLASCLGGSGSF